MAQALRIPPHSPFTTPLAASRQPQATNPSVTLRVCTNRTCRRQGSQQILKTLQDLTVGREGVSVVECGCLGNCGAGPNMVLLPEERVLAHVATPADAVEVLSAHCGITVSRDALQAVALRQAGNAAALEGDLERAVQLYTQGLALKDATQHLLLSNRSAALLQLGRKQEALDDARAALNASPANFHTAWVRLIDCLWAQGHMEEARAAFAHAESVCPSFRTCAERKSIVNALGGAKATAS